MKVISLLSTLKLLYRSGHMLYAEGWEGERGGLNLSGWEYGLLWMSRFVCVV